MAEHPLLPHRRLRELHALMLRARKLCRRHDPTGSSPREALMAAALTHTLAGDLLCAQPTDAAVSALSADPRGEQSLARDAQLPELKTASNVSLAAALARGVKAAERQGVVLAFVNAYAPETSGWSEALSWAVERKLPLLLICTDDLRQRTRKPPVGRAGKSTGASVPLSWTEVSRAARHVTFPVFSFDGEDAVATFRVVQETILRARSGDGPSVLWAVLGSEQTGKPLDPVARLRRYMSARSIPLTGG